MRLKVLIGLLLCLALQAQKAITMDPVKDVPLGVSKGMVTLAAPAGAHLKAAFMSVKLAAGTPGRIQVGPLPPTNGKDDLGDGIWRGPVAIPVTGEGLKGDVDLVVTYQPCTEGESAICFAPQDRVVRVSAAELEGGASAGEASWASAGLLWSLLAVFGFGMLASLTPCVYPMIPITLAIVGAKGGGRMRGFLLSLTLVLGMAVTYTILGVAAARTGAAFGAWAQRPAFLIPVAVLFGFFALSLFGLFELQLPEGLRNRLQGGPRKGFLGAFLMGLVLGPISAPCVGPVVASVLLAIASHGQVAYGGLQLFVFALGMGVLFMAVGTFGASLPRSGDWLVRLKQGMGLVVLGFAVWSIRYVVPGWLEYALWAGTLLAAAGVFRAFVPAESLGSAFAKGLGLLALVLALFLGVRAVETGLGLELLPRGGGEAKSEVWRQAWVEQDFEGALARAKAERKVVVVDVWAQWCAACRELDEKTWPDPGLSAWLSQNAVPVRVDTDAVRKDLAKTWKILGYPTVMVIGPDGGIRLRREGFQNPQEMLAFLKGGATG